MSNEYVKSLFTPRPNKVQGRKVWGIDLESVWLPTFIASNTIGDTAIPQEALGAPLRLSYDKAGAVRFGLSGRPIIRVAKELADNVRMVRENVVANLMDYVGVVQNEHPEAYGGEVNACAEAGKPIVQLDKIHLTRAIEAAAAEAATEAAAKAEAVKEADKITKAPKGRKEAVTA